MKTFFELREKTLTPAELKKRKEVADAIKRDNPDMPMAKKMAIATATAKKVAEEAEQIDELSKKTLGQYIKVAGHDREQRQKKATGLSQVGHEVKGHNRKQADDLFHRAGAELHKAANRKAGINKAVNKLVGEEVELDEAVEVSHDRYMRSHGKKASGGEGNWMFTHKRMGDANVNDSKEVHSARGKFSDAKKSAQQWAKKHGHSTVYVMEEVEELDELKKSTLASYVKKSADDLTHIQRDITSGGTQDPEYKGLSRMRKNRKAGISRAVNTLAKEEVEQVDEISRDLARRYIRKVADKTNTGELSTKEVEKRRPGVNLAGKKAYPSIAGKARVTATEEVEKVDEVSVMRLGQYTTKAAQQGSKRVAGQWMADQKLRKRDGYSSSAKVAATSTPKKD